MMLSPSATPASSTARTVMLRSLGTRNDPRKVAAGFTMAEIGLFMWGAGCTEVELTNLHLGAPGGRRVGQVGAQTGLILAFDQRGQLIKLKLEIANDVGHSRCV